MFGKQSTREIAMLTAKQFEDHVKLCTSSQEETRRSIDDLGKARVKSDDERRAQFEALNKTIMKVMWSVIAGLAVVAYDLLKGKGIL